MSLKDCAGEGEIRCSIRSCEEVAPRSALGLLDALAETAAKARVTSEYGNPNFGPEAFASPAARDAGRVR